MQTLNNWTEWKERCALALCGPATQSALRTIASRRFMTFIRKYAHKTNTPNLKALAATPADVWHWFETHLMIRDNREGKSYKKWLFKLINNQSEPSQNTIESGFSVLMREVVREHLRQEFLPCWTTSLENTSAPDSPGSGQLTSPATLLPVESPGTETAQRELSTMAHNEARKLIAILPERERFTLLIRELGLTFANPQVLKHASREKTVLFESHRNALMSIATHIRSKCPREDTETLAHLTIMTFREIKDLIVAWGRSEKSLAQFFALQEGHPNEQAQ